MSTIRREPFPCPYCGNIQDALSSATNESCEPSQGDISICMSCGEISMIEADLTERKMTPEELAEANKEIIHNPRLFFALHLIRAVAAARKKAQAENPTCARMNSPTELS